MFNSTRMQSESDSVGVMSLSDFLVNITLADWQRAQLEGISAEGIHCLLEHWINFTRNPLQEPHCNAAWDGITCWPATPTGTRVSVPCSEVMKNDSRFNPEDLTGEAYRACLENRTGYVGNWSDYQECEEAVEDALQKLRRIANPARYIVRYILYYGSIASVICLMGSLFIFFHFKSIRCERIKIHINMMIALLLKSVIMIIMVHHTVFKKSFNYKNLDWVCKPVISLQFYATVAAINWMFVQGHHLNSKLTNVVVKEFPMRYYIFIGWGIPLGIVGIWSFSTEITYGTKCWQNYPKMHTIWILVVSLSIVLMVNLLLLLNILRVVISSARRFSTTETLTTRSVVGNKIKRGTKAAAILFPLLGMTNLIFVYNPGGDIQKYYMVAQASLHSLQGILTSILYCFICKDVRDAMRREYYRFQSKRHPSVGRSQRLAISFRSRDAAVSIHRQRESGRECVQIQAIAIDADKNPKVKYPTYAGN